MTVAMEVWREGWSLYDTWSHTISNTVRYSEYRSDYSPYLLLLITYRIMINIFYILIHKLVYATIFAEFSSVECTDYGTLFLGVFSVQQIDMILPTRVSWRPPSKPVLKNASTISFATSTPVTLPPSAIMLALLWRRHMTAP